MNRNQRGMTLLEVMIAMTIGMVIIGGALTVFVDSSRTQRVNERVARMQENARFAMDTILPDLRLAGFWGQRSGTTNMQGHAGSTGQLATIGGDCADRWYVDLENAVWASNGANPWTTTCLAAAEYQAGTDILVVRRAEIDPTMALENDIVYVRADRLRAVVFPGDTTPGGTFSGDEQDHRLVVHAYYVRPYSFTVGDGIPSLRRIVLRGDGSDPALQHEEVIPGIEDLQVQYGVDDDEDGAVNRYVDPDTALGANARILAIRVWVMARADRAELEFTDALTYTYADRSVTPNDAFRRLLVTTTTQLRNLMPVPEA